MERIIERYFTPSSDISPRISPCQLNKKQAKYLFKDYKGKYKFNQVFDQVTVYNDGTIERLYTE